MKEIFSINVTPSKAAAVAVGGIIGPWIDLFYGNGRLLPILLLIIVIFIDWITGVAAAHKDRTYSSDYGLRKGLPRTLFLLALPIVANLMDTMISSPGLFFYAITLGMIYHTWQSLTANALRAGWGKWIPTSVFSLIESELKAKTERAQKRAEEAKDNDTAAQ
jgi:toxin secretion/phage lysis holin